jgi:hypothetical protein
MVDLMLELVAVYCFYFTCTNKSYNEKFSRILESSEERGKEIYNFLEPRRLRVGPV